ncbi:DNA glycosylase [Mucidula mucida]|nr:DNA glycosylase [Mucidula mucida]
MVNSLKRSASPSVAIQSAHSTKKLKIIDDFAKTSPFPDFHRPSPKEALEVHKILSELHPSTKSYRDTSPPKGNSAQTCGHAPNVIEALIGTILSQNTSGKNSSRAKSNLDAAFGRNNFSSIASAPLDSVIEAIRSGGLANKKAATIQSLLHSIRAKHGEYSLQHLSASEDSGSRMSDEAIMKELVSYKGVGPKTASCVLLFCIGRDSFAVDTHVYRLSKMLGWVPQSADRVRAQAHLDLKIPSEVKYGLHVLMIKHGRVCKSCSGRGSEDSCMLKSYIRSRDESLC